MKILASIAAVIALTAIAVPAAIVVAYRAHPDIAALQRLADKSCKCARAASGNVAKDACWEEFDHKVKLDRSDTRNLAGTACYPLSEISIRVDSGEVILGYGIVASDGLELCSKEEAMAGEAIWYRIDSQGTTEEERQISYQRADAALRQFATELAKGRPLGKVVPEMGCVTGYPGP